MILLYGKHTRGDAQRKHALLFVRGSSFAASLAEITRDVPLGTGSRQPGYYHYKHGNEVGRETLLPVGRGDVFVRHNPYELPIHETTMVEWEEWAIAVPVLQQTGLSAPTKHIQRRERMGNRRSGLVADRTKARLK